MGCGKHPDILGLSSRLPEIAAGFSGGGLICSTHASQRVARQFTHVVDEVRHSDFAPRADDADGAHELGSHGDGFCRWMAMVRAAMVNSARMWSRVAQPTILRVKRSSMTAR